ncbi:PTS system, glucose-specific enzyme II, A component [Oceanobacillus iheyensis HTE831]|uniref:PTS system, glucose-specific enzyme II, A component n=1 Tax=Oceanobacillus iheyensis (strain DSM 14371 / CIP 107618 / JCM 11309 / KCTC 3954 / HTE831) TaxID=221109 RepID=Q8EQ41_OCEIH|nr:glucose-specific PTS transporter subunit IIBC [Oceanobacillus iheyensis]BAC13838.1 PTS system, glucose-specific enzyme II, A component [Oceanobacillus iheyensis HTE831]
MFKKAFGLLQKIGKALMLPVALLPVAGLLLGLGNAVQQNTVLEYLPFLHMEWIQLIATVMEDAGGIIFDNLPLIFAIGVSIGLASDGAAGLAALVGYLVLNQVMGSWIGVTSKMIESDPSFASVLGIPTLQTGVFGGIIVGLIAAFCYNRFHDIEMPSFLGFFAGKRFVPIATAGCSFVIGILLMFIWPPVQDAMNSASYWLIEEGTYVAVFLFGFIKRLLIPFGLHHIFHAPFWYEFGSFETEAGNIVRGDMAIFFAQLKDGVEFTAGHFMAGEFPIMMFGLPAAALAMYHAAKPEKKKLVAGLLVSGALTSFLTGITEPLEFSFMFLSPILFLIHALLDGLSFVLMTYFHVNIGFTFSGGAIDFVLFGILPGQEPWWITIILGLFFAIIYYFLFRYFIKKFNLLTPGREESDDHKYSPSSEKSDLAFDVVEAIGGLQNITHLDACITRLRVSVDSIQKVNKVRLKKIGASGVLVVGNNVQAIFGPRSETIKGQIQDIILGKVPRLGQEFEYPVVEEPISVNDEIIVSPLTGQMIPITDVSDPVFSGKLMGEGFAIIPEDGTIVSPVDGEIIHIFPTNHAIGVQSEEGTEILIHAGLDTVNLNGKGFNIFVDENQFVKAGQALLKVDLDYLEKQGFSTVTPVVFTNIHDLAYIHLLEEKVEKGQSNIIAFKRVQ